MTKVETSGVATSEASAAGAAFEGGA